MKILVFDFVEQHLELDGLHCTKLERSQQRTERSLIVVSLLLVTAPASNKDCWMVCNLTRKCLHCRQDLNSTRARGEVLTYDTWTTILFGSSSHSGSSHFGSGLKAFRFDCASPVELASMGCGNEEGCCALFLPSCL